MSSRSRNEFDNDVQIRAEGELPTPGAPNNNAYEVRTILVHGRPLANDFAFEDNLSGDFLPLEENRSGDTMLPAWPQEPRRR
jgi:hypothetical protein